MPTKSRCCNRCRRNCHAGDANRRLLPPNARVQASLNTIAASARHVTVIGDEGGPFTITFNNALTGNNVSQLAAVALTLWSQSSISTVVDGSLPTAAQVQVSLNTIPALAGNVQVSGPTNGTYTITFGVGLTGVNVSPITTGRHRRSNGCGHDTDRRLPRPRQPTCSKLEHDCRAEK